MTAPHDQLAHFCAVVGGAYFMIFTWTECTKPAPQPPPPAPPPIATGIWNKLTEAGCLNPADDAGLADIVHNLTLPPDAQPAWFQCLTDGGSIAQCGVPCATDAAAAPGP